MNHTAIFTILFLVSLGIFCGLAWRRLSLIRLGRPENRFGSIPARIGEMLLFAFGQKKVLARPFGVNHITMHPQLSELIDVCAKHQVGHVVLAGGLPPGGAI